MSAQASAAWAQSARTRLAVLDAELARRFDAGEPTHALTRARADGVESLILEAWTALLPGDAGLSLLAVGGFGRRSLYPQSDVDLLVLHDAPLQAETTDALARFIAQLWDAHIEVSHAVRTLQECAQAAAQDITIHTALMDARTLAGDQHAAQRLAAVIAPENLWPPEAYFRAKREELRQRHARFGDTADNLEPNIKEGPGGLRDLQTLRWMSTRVHGTGHLAELEAMNLIGADEHQTLLRAASQLQRLRWGLHLVAGKREERLRFDYQRLLAARLAGQTDADNAAVEQMMQGFYRSAALVMRIAERLLQRLEEHLEGVSIPKTLDENFELRGRWLSARKADWPEGDAAQIFALFQTWAGLPEDTGLHSETARALAENLALIPAHGEASPALCAQFMQLLPQNQAVTTLKRMSQLGVLARWIPAFAQVTGRMQFDLFHVYTVDQHTLALLANFALFRQGTDRQRFSLAHEVWPLLEKPELLLLAGLFHDIAKGRGGDHSELGAVDARVFAEAVGLSPGDTELVAWLVEKHLLMSVTAQKQDISDPEVVQRFAAIVARRERLDMLYLLTCADIAATSPKLWNGWKDRLLADLYLATRKALQRGLENPLNITEYGNQTHTLAQTCLQQAHQISAETAQTWLAALPEESFLRGQPEQIAWQAEVLAAAPDAALHVAARALADEHSGALEVFVHAPDRDGLFAAIAATLDRAGLAIGQARLLNSAQGEVFDTLQGLPLDPRRKVSAAEVEKRLLEALAKPDLSAVRAPRRSQPRHLRHFRIPPQISFSPAAGGQRSQLSLVCTDRPGLLSDITQVFRTQGLRVHDARIATFGERAEDIFQLTDARNAPLDDTIQARLGEALIRTLQGDNP
ncbi:[protein-PII] uridylyltransferase [Lysobacteraceae bacterium NML08-0793]|nr:[protein-PII] uridylyltransferase [Xanthomonadaceae bacterium NML08-0793]